MIDNVLEAVKVCEPASFFDGTMWHGGHTVAVSQVFPNIDVAWCDVDADVLAVAKNRFQESNVHIDAIHGSYAEKESYQEKKRDMILLDLWINRHHIRDDARGFSFQSDGPLDMRFDQKWPTCYEVLQRVKREDLEQAFMLYGDFSPLRASNIATLLMKHKKELTTTNALTDILATLGIRRQWCAVFYQVLRILTNREWDNIASFLDLLPDVLSPGGLCLVMTYHSWEDRIVKQWFRDLVAQDGRDLYTKKVIKPHYKEVERNKAARSALLRWIYKK